VIARIREDGERRWTMMKELTAGELKAALERVSDDTPILFEGDVDMRWGQYVTSEVRVDPVQGVVIS
jgi:hypothetical protein